MNDGPGTNFLDYWIGRHLRQIKSPAQGGHAQNLNRLLFSQRQRNYPNVAQSKSGSRLAQHHAKGIF